MPVAAETVRNADKELIIISDAAPGGYCVHYANAEKEKRRIVPNVKDLQQGLPWVKYLYPAPALMSLVGHFTK